MSDTEHVNEENIGSGRDVEVEEKLRNVHALRIQGQGGQTKHKTPNRAPVNNSGAVGLFERTSSGSVAAR